MLNVLTHTKLNIITPFRLCKENIFKKTRISASEFMNKHSQDYRQIAIIRDPIERFASAFVLICIFK